jgi:hypothetical protein
MQEWLKIEVDFGTILIFTKLPEKMHKKKTADAQTVCPCLLACRQFPSGGLQIQFRYSLEQNINMYKYILICSSLAPPGILFRNWLSMAWFSIFVHSHILDGVKASHRNTDTLDSGVSIEGRYTVQYQSHASSWSKIAAASSSACGKFSPLVNRKISEWKPLFR